MCLHFATKRTRIDVVDEGALAVDLDHREPLPVLGLQPFVARDVDLLEVEAELVAECGDHAAGALAEVAARGVVQGYLSLTDKFRA